MVKFKQRIDDEGRWRARIDDGPEVIMGDGNLSYRETKDMPRRNEVGLNAAVKIAAFFCLSFFSILMFVKLIKYIFSGGF